MFRLLLVLSAALCLAAHADMYTEIHGDGVYTVDQNKSAQKKVDAIQREWETGRLRAMAERTDFALNGLMRIAIKNLRYRGFRTEAREMEQGWAKHEGAVTRLVNKRDRKIGDFEPLSKWLAVAYFILEEKLSYDICRALRLSDLMTFNFAIPVVFNPCAHGEVEFGYHFCHDDPNSFHPYRGLGPVVSYWATVITCSIATYGAGYFFICSPIGMLVELGVDRIVAPWLSPKIYSWACTN